MFIAKLTYKTDLDTILSNRPAHVEFLDKYYKQQKFIMSGRQNNNKGGIIVVNSNNEEEVWNIVKQDPFYTNKLADYEIIGFTATNYTKELKDLVKE